MSAGSVALEADVAVVGAGIAGCTAATLFARAGAHVALIESRPDIDDYKRACTHVLQPSARPVLERLDLLDELTAAGAVNSAVDIWTRWGWIRPRFDGGRAGAYALNLRRATLDPLLRRMAAATPGVELLTGHALTALRRDGRRTAGVVARRGDGGELEIRARLVVAADGRASHAAGLAGVRVRTQPNRRFCTYAYFRDLPLSSGDGSQIWFLEPDVAFALPNDDGITLVVYFAREERLPEFRRDREAEFLAAVRALPDAPIVDGAERVGPVMGQLVMPNIRRRGTAQGMALVGDAALASDPVVGVGCSWAFQSAAWLVDATADTLGDPNGLDRALRRYCRRHRAELAGHQRLIAQGAKAGPLSPVERLFLSAATNDPETARHLYDFATRTIPPRRFLAPSALRRAIRARRAPRPGDGSTMQTATPAR